MIGHCRFALASRQLDAAFDIPAHGITGLFGPSGGGKTTLLRCIAGLEPEARGRLEIGGETWQDDARGIRVPTAQRAIGYVFQEGRLFPHLSVERNLLYGWRRNRSARPAVSRDQAIELLGLGALLQRKPQQLSGGEQQRVAIGRALLRAPRLILMDEPLANLDVVRKQEILPFLDRLHAALALPILYVSHSLDEITRLCDHLVVIDSGRIAAAGELNQVLTQVNVPVLRGDEASSVLPGRVQDFEQRFELTRVAYSGGVIVAAGRHGPPGTPVRLRILARDVSLCRTRPLDSTILNILPATIDSVDAADGAHATVRLRVGGDALLAQITRHSAETLGLAAGQSVYAQIKGVAVKNLPQKETEY
jgi:molybdate transport system ATP-binding protein